MSDSIVLEHPLNLAENKGAKLRRQRVYIFLSRQGLIFICLLLVMLLGAVNYSNSMAYILVFLLSSLFMVCMLHTYKNLRGLVLSTSATSPVFAGEMALFPLLLDNRLGPARTGLEIGPYPKNVPRKKRESHQSNKLSTNVEPDKLQRENLAVNAVKRGKLQLGRLRITSTFPLGLFRAWSYMPTTRSCTVYPKPAGSPTLPLPVSYDVEEHTGNKAGTDDFVGFRQYRQGDSIRNIDWKAVARERGLLVKRFSGSGASKLSLHWDLTSHFPNTEQRLSQLCLWVLEAERQGIHYSLDLPAVSVDLGTGDAHKHHCLEKLAGYGHTES